MAASLPGKRGPSAGSDHVIESGIPTEGLLAQIAISKYADGLPLYRQEGSTLASASNSADRRWPVGWAGLASISSPWRTGYWPISGPANASIADETTLPTLAPGSGKTKTAWLWTYVRDDRPFGRGDPPMVAYRFEDSRGGACAERHLAGFAGLLQVDGFSAYNRLAATDRPGGPVTLAACWAHLRRKFYELHVADVSRIATATVEQMSDLWAIEAEIRGKHPATRQAIRQARSAQSSQRSSRSGNRNCRASRQIRDLPKRSAMRRGRAGSRTLPADGRLDIDSNPVERADPPANDHPQECAVRRIRRRRVILLISSCH